VRPDTWNAKGEDHGKKKWKGRREAKTGKERGKQWGTVRAKNEHHQTGKDRVAKNSVKKDGRKRVVELWKKKPVAGKGKKRCGGTGVPAGKYHGQGEQQESIKEKKERRGLNQFAYMDSHWEGPSALKADIGDRSEGKRGGKRRVVKERGKK